MFGRFRPARDNGNEVKVIVDLDRLISQSVGFMLHGKVRRVKPMTMDTFLFVTNELAALDVLRQQKTHDYVGLRKAYAKLIKRACEPISDHEIKLMTDPQIAALIQHIIDCVRGNGQMSAEKKTPKTD